MTNAEMLTTRKIRKFQLAIGSLDRFTEVWEADDSEKPVLHGEPEPLPPDAVPCLAWHSWPLTHVAIYSDTYAAVPADQDFPFGGHVR